MNRFFSLPCSIAVSAWLVVFLAQTNWVSGVETPRVLDPNWQIELIASEPELVTPTGCCLDDDGRLMVIECHTHFPPQDYKGPKTDRIYRFEDSDGNGSLDKRVLFYEGGTTSMNLASLGDGWIAVSSRSEVVKLRDQDGDGQADQRVVLVTHKTNANYPHNGLGGLAFANDGWLYVGQGENFGEPYELIGSDGSKQIGGGEGGNVFRCKPDGGCVERVATGFWNPFGMCSDSSGRLWSVENDPDSMPPNRLLQVVPTGDYGFQFRFGRAGIHPLQSWDGEFPGTLPMAAGVGEGACAVATHGEHLWVTSWGDNRVERYQLAEKGASWTSQSEVVVQGDADFRPVGMTVAQDGSLYISDWVDRSYPVHGKGRLWRLYRKSTSEENVATLPKLSEAEKEARRIQEGEATSLSDRLAALKSEDSFLRQAAIAGLVRFNQIDLIDRADLGDSQQKVGFLLASRWRSLIASDRASDAKLRSLFQWGLEDESEAVVLTALRIATESKAKENLPLIRSLLGRESLSSRLFSATIASIAFLETGNASPKSRDPAIEKLLVEFIRDEDHSPRLRGLAVQRIPADADEPSNEELVKFIVAESDRSFSREVVRLLVARGTDSANEQLASIAANESLDVQTRADAVAGLAQKAASFASVVNKLTIPRQPAELRQEALRVRNQNVRRDNPARPSRDNLTAWDSLLGKEGNVDAGRRVFFRRGCSNCHEHSGRGANTGPDLTSLAGSMTRTRVIESILNPSKEVGPLYVPWKVLTTDGRAFVGLKLHAPGVGSNLRFQGAEGNLFEVPLAEIELQESVTESIMPNGLEDSMSLEELRDLVEFLTIASN